jgi:hypothetical protein
VILIKCPVVQKLKGAILKILETSGSFIESDHNVEEGEA